MCVPIDHAIFGIGTLGRLSSNARCNRLGTANGISCGASTSKIVLSAIKPDASQVTVPIALGEFVKLRALAITPLRVNLSGLLITLTCDHGICCVYLVQSVREECAPCLPSPLRSLNGFLASWGSSMPCATHA